MSTPPEIVPLADGSGFRLLLPDGRSLGFRERGAPEGTPLLWFPGTPGSRLFAPPDEAALSELGIRLVIVERPGFGASTFQPNRRIVDWPGDVAALADALALDRFAIAGASGAGPYLAATAWALPERLTRVGMIGVVGPADAPSARRGLSLRRRAILGLASRAPGLALWQVRRARLAEDPDRFYREATKDAPPCDQRALAPMWDRQVEMTAEALRPGVEGFVWELHLAARPWGFPLEEIRTQVLLWHGAADAASPIATARYLASAIPRCRATIVENAGHFLHFERARWREIMAALAARGD
jgi:pimeloyl-ACP methyl ester carboxylesterase